MNLKTLTLGLALAAPLVFSSGAVLAKGTPQTHHCKLADGTMDMKKTKKECAAAKGAWAKDAGMMPTGTTTEGGKPAMPMPTTKMPMKK